MAQFGSVAALPRTKTADIKPVQSVKVVPDGVSGGGREVYRWAVDTYNTMTVGVYMPTGERLPKDGLTITPEDFDLEGGTDKERRGRAVASYRDETVGEAGESLSVFIEAPADYDFESITISHA